MTRTRSVVTQSLQYLSGLLQTVRKNVERMTEVVPETEYLSLHHVTTHSPWAHRPVMDQVALDADRLLGGSPDTALVRQTATLNHSNSIAKAQTFPALAGSIMMNQNLTLLATRYSRR